MDSIGALEEALRLLPENLPIRRQLALALASAGDYAAALRQVDQLLARVVDDPEALLLGARCLVEVGRPAEALERYQAAVARDAAVADAALRHRIEQSGPRLAAAPLSPAPARLRLVDGVGGAGGGGAERSPTPPAAPRITFADVGGLDDVKERARRRLIQPLARPDLFAAFGQTAGGGLLLFGPPGCGKTHLCRAIAGEAGLPLITVGVDDVLDMWLGSSEKRLAEQFEEARRRAPALLFFDEVDALGGRRSPGRHESYRTLVTQFLTELDGAGGAGRMAGVLVVGATNAPWDVDPAFRRPGRFGDVLFVPPPELAARVEILRLRLAGRPHRDDLDLLAVARRTELCSGADLVRVVDLACEAALAASLGQSGVQPITSEQLLAASAQVRPTTREWFAAARSFVEYGNEGGQYDEVRDYLRRHSLT